MEAPDNELLTKFNTYPFFAWVKFTAEYFFHTINERQSVIELRKTILETYIQYVTERRGVNGSDQCLWQLCECDFHNLPWNLFHNPQSSA